MRKRFPSLALLCLCFLVPALSHAQFQEPTKEELQMTQDPKAPGADAVYFYREETTDDALHFHGYYERIKVLTEKGKEQATVRIPYERGESKVADIKGRTIHPDGTVVPLTTKPSDLMEVKTNSFQINEMVFTLPDVVVGSILEYRLQIRYDDNWVSAPVWEIQQPFFVHKAHYYFNPSKSGYISDSRGNNLNRLMYSTSMGPEQKVVQDPMRRFTVDLTDIPAIPNEDWMPPLNTVRWRLVFYYTYADSGTEFWKSEAKQWAKDTEHFTNPSGELKKAVSEIVSPGDTEEQKARKIYAAVMKLDNTRFTRKKSEAERKAQKLKTIKAAEDVWNQKSGSDDNIALLYVALGRAAGLKVWPMQVVDRSRAFFDGRFLSLNQLDDYIAIVEIDGKDVYLDPGQKMCPFGELNWKHTLASGLRLSQNGANPGTTPPGIYKTAVLDRVADINVDADGTVKGTVRIMMKGPDALHWRQLTLENDVEEVKKQFNESIRNDVPDGVQVDFDHFISLDEYESNLMAVVKVSGNLGVAVGKRFILPGIFFESHAKHPFVAQDKRIAPIDVHYSKMVEDDVTYHVPSGFTVEGAPQPTTALWPDHAVFKIASHAIPDGENVQRSLVYNFTLLGSTDYPSLHDFYQKVATADQQQLVLTRATVAKGN